MAKNYYNCIYVLRNPSYAGYVKIGYASDLASRLATLNTGMLQNFRMFAVYETPNRLADKQFHAIIDDLAPVVRARVFEGQKVQDKEFFKLEPEQAYDLLHHIAVMTGTENRLHKFDEPEPVKQEAAVSNSVNAPVHRIVRNQTERPATIRIGHEYFPFQTWVQSWILHCDKIIEKIGFSAFKIRVLSMDIGGNKNTKRKIFAETEEEMRGFSFHKFSEGNLYMLTNYSGEYIKKINAFMAEEFPEIEFEYIYMDKDLVIRA